jgi:predicted nucleotidyltransferase
MQREEALRRLAECSAPLQARGAAALFLFGSTARGEASPASDLDLFIDVMPDRKFSLLDLAGIQLFLADRLGVPVDVATRGGLHPMLRETIEREAVRVF